MKKNIIPNIKEQISFIYIDYGKIHQLDSGICLYQKDRKINIPCASTLCIILGPGTSITHRAIQNISNSGCLLVWAGENFDYFYAYASNNKQNTNNLLKQISYHENINKHLIVARKMYHLRFQKEKLNISNMNITQMRGAEGNRMKKIYQDFSKEYNVLWNGRQYDKDNWNNSDLINTAISKANTYLYNICHAVILVLGLSPAIGFIHTGTMKSFIYDIADIYKHRITIPASFKTVSENKEDFKGSLRYNIHEFIKREKIMKTIAGDVLSLFDENSQMEIDLIDETMLWNDNNNIKSGINYGE